MKRTVRPIQKIAYRPEFFRQNVEPKKMRGRNVATDQSVRELFNAEMSKAQERNTRRGLAFFIYSGLVFPVALWLMLGLGVVHSHFGVVPALGYWETTLVVLAIQSASFAVNAGRNGNG